MNGIFYHLKESVLNKFYSKSIEILRSEWLLINYIKKISKSYISFHNYKSKPWIINYRINNFSIANFMNLINTMSPISENS